MIRTQIQLPEPLYREVRRVAAQQDWSIAEVIRRGAEAVVRNYPDCKIPGNPEQRFPPPLDANLVIIDADRLKDAIRSDEEFRP